MSDLVPLLNYVSFQEAHQIRNLLDAEGVPSFVEGEQTSSMMTHVGAVAGIRLFVAAQHVSRAEAILSEARKNANSTQGPAWFCGTCQEIVQSDFSVCWSCGGLREDVADPDVDVSQLLDESDGEHRTEDEFELISPTELDISNPYAASGLSASRPQVNENDLSEELASRMSRAWRAALLGLVFLPMLLSFYSILLLLTLPNREFWPAPAVHRYRLTMAVNVLAIATWFALGWLFVLN